MSNLDSFRLDGRVAVISGASSGLGVDFAVALARAGADVVLAAGRTEGLARTADLVSESGRQALMVQVDLSNPDDCRRVITAAMDHFGRVDVFVNNAGVGIAVPALKETPKQFRQVIDVNLTGPYWLAQAAAAIMQPGSSIINLSSVLALTTLGSPRPPTAPTRPPSLG